MRIGSRWIASFSWYLAGLLVCSCITLGLIRFRFDSFRDAIDFVNGKTIAVDRPTLALGPVDPSSRHTVIFQLTNRGFTPVRLVGFTSGCMIEPPPEMPFVLRPMQTRPFPVTLTMPPRSANFTATNLPVTLYTSLPDQREIRVSIELANVDSVRPVASR